MAKLLPPITLNGTTYRVLRLNPSDRGPRFLLRSATGELLGLFPCNVRPARLYAAPLVARSAGQHPLARVDFFDSDGRLIFR